MIAGLSERVCSVDPVRLPSAAKPLLTIALALILCVFPGSALATTFTVTSPSDSGAGSLRAAIEGASAGDYAATSAELTIDKNLTIIGAGARNTTINAMKSNHGVFEIEGGAVTIEKLKITGAEELGGSGGGIDLKGGSATLDEVEVTADSVSTGGDGGGIYASSGTHLTIDASTISNNLAYNGGGLNLNGTATIEDSTIAGNDAGSNSRNGDGGGLQNNAGTLTLVNDTIAYNESFNGPSGGGIWGNASAKNTIIADNSDNTAAIDNCSAALEAKGPNLENGTECEFAAHSGLSKANPLLGALANNGGETETLALLVHSPAIDAGTDEGCPATDQRGVKRPQGASCDIGAYEFQTVADLGVTQSASATTLAVGGKVTYTLKVSNGGPEGASGVLLQDTLPADSTLVSAVPSQGTCSGSAPVRCALGTLASGASAAVTLTVQLNQVGTNVNTASVSSEATDNDEANNQSQLAVTVTAGGGPPPPTPAIAHLEQSHPSWLEKKTHRSPKHVPVGTRFSFTLSEAASVTLTFTQHLPGRSVKGRCVAQTHKNRRAHSCRRALTRGTLPFSGKSGSNTLSFAGRVPHVGLLASGTYTLTVQAVNAAGKRSAPATLTFKID